MSHQLRFTILGCGSSPGTPRITGDWGACDPNEPKNRRSRCAALVERVNDRGDVTRVVIDCGPDFRTQMLTASVPRLDGIVVTHAHADHFHGLDDVRGYFLDQKRRIDIFSDSATYARMFEAFAYCYETPVGSDYPPIVRHRLIEPNVELSIDGPGGAIDFIPFHQEHGSIHSLGLRIGPIAYCSDVSGFPTAAQEAIRGSDLLVIDALQYRPHPSHFSVGQALEWIEKLKVPMALLTHMNTPLDYNALKAVLPKHVQPAYDGLCMTFRM